MAAPATIGPNELSKQHLERLVEVSKRQKGIQLPVPFVRSTDGAPPLVRFIRGGHGGEVRLKLYLTVTLLATKAPYEITREIAGRTWAEMLGLPDPEINGARRVTDALAWLHREQFLEVQRRSGRPPTLKMLDPAGDGTPYRRPTMPYITLPVGYWEEQWITVLSGIGTAILIVLLDLVGGKKRDPSQSLSATQRARYGLSADSWTRATKELRDHGIITAIREVRGNGLEWRRARTVYTVNLARLNQAP
jgi:hypothetical protein